MSAYSPSASLPFMPMPGQPGPAYPLLFRSETEIPPFFVQYRWWEDEAATVFWAFDPLEIQRVIRFGLYSNASLPRSILQNRDPHTIREILVSLVSPDELAFVDSLSPLQKVEEILRRCRDNRAPLVPWSWVPTQRDRDMNPLRIAEAIDAESQVQFTRISFERLVRYSLTLKEPAVEWFLQQHTALYIHLIHFLQMFPEELPRYLEVEQHLRSRSPFAHRAVHQCLRDLRQAVPGRSSSPAFEFVAGPIQQLFLSFPPSLKDALKVLSVLGARFERTYIHAREMNWTKPFAVDFSFLEDLTASMSADDFAKTITTGDQSCFSGLTQKSFVEPDAVIKRLLVTWELMSMAVWECCTGLPELIEYIEELAQALYNRHDYHAFAAILSGLFRYNTSFLKIHGNTAIPSPVLPQLAGLMDPAENFVAYRQEFQQRPGIPFLFPHIREYQQHGPPALHQLFQRLQTSNLESNLH
ncbi:uncharacterized protein BO80DRAFT_458858 [Aspergillus ibericus CBS 121593]|uniref:Ras-GEF domain-containing protein n=1 Tax=Aspergillus ibericus CBS 121593 TaxID=1448316 RepID=A0A395GMC5_9EURO|nr:hypothetical protein BO80DRAFT_458858 [Aspergillus ibericus CBS 121593]RAK96544.1 hypothetical protein BO80DRAFT_458858 [Aspergillus ibericus CBS 121593]